MPPLKEYFRILIVSVFISARKGLNSNMGAQSCHAFLLAGYLEQAKNLYRGNTLSSCPMPCKTFKTKTKMISKRAAAPLGRVLLSFSEKVSMTITELETQSVSELLSSIGGSVGLWLGLGAFQAIEILSRIFFAMADKVRIT